MRVYNDETMTSTDIPPAKYAGMTYTHEDDPLGFLPIKKTSSTATRSLCWRLSSAVVILTSALALMFSSYALYRQHSLNERLDLLERDLLSRPQAFSRDHVTSESEGNAPQSGVIYEEGEFVGEPFDIDTSDDLQGASFIHSDQPNNSLKGAFSGQKLSRERRAAKRSKTSKREKRANARRNRLRKRDIVKIVNDTVTQLLAGSDISQSHVFPRAHFQAAVSQTALDTSRRNPALAVPLSGVGSLKKGSLAPLDDVSYRFWEASSGTDTGLFNFDRSVGTVTVNTAGSYLMYAQVLYHDSGPRVAYAVMAGERVLAKCLMSSSSLDPDSAPRHEDYQTCSTTTAVVLAKDDQVYLKPLYVAQSLIPDSATTMWGLIKLGS